MLSRRFWGGGARRGDVDGMRPARAARPPGLAAWLLGLAVALCAPSARAQLDELIARDPEELGVSAEEASAFALVQAGQPITARERAEEILKRDPNSFVAHLVLGQVLHEAEASYPLALFHLQRALDLFEAKYTERPSPDQPWRFHAALLAQLAETHGDLEHHRERLRLIALFNELYDPDMIAEQAWTLMKLGRHQEARLAANQGLAQEERPAQRMIALNALCAIEFEAGDDGASYEACKRAVDDARLSGRLVSAVDLTNLAEAARSLFQLDEAERLAIEATQAPVSFYGNPWLDLAELYTRQGRFPEALAALKEIPAYRTERPAETRAADQNEVRRALSAFLVTLSKGGQAREITAQALVRPDRRAHQSRNAIQDGVVVALLDRAARHLVIEREAEQAATRPWYARLTRYLGSLPERFAAYQSARRAARLLSEHEPLVGTFRIGTASAAIIPPWLIGELVQVLGPGVVHTALAEARKGDKRKGASGYYDAVEAEALLSQGRLQAALTTAERSLQSLGGAEQLLRGRVFAVAAQAAWRLEHGEKALTLFESAFQSDPGVLRRLGMSVPVQLQVGEGAVADDIADAIMASPRFERDPEGMRLEVRSDGGKASACLYGVGRAVIACGRASGADADTLVQDAVESLHEEVFAPRVTLTAADINSLDGSNLMGREALEEALSE